MRHKSPRRVRWHCEVLLEAESGSGVTLQFEGDRRRRAMAALERMTGQRELADPRIPFGKPASAPLRRLGQAILQPGAIIILDQPEDPREPIAVIVTFHIRAPRELLARTAYRPFYACAAARYFHAAP
jgi:hypothetical protein